MAGLKALLATGFVAATLFLARGQDTTDTIQSLMAARNEAAQKVWTLATKLSGTSEEMIGDQVGESRQRWSLRLAESAADAGVLSIQGAYAQHLARMTEFAESTKRQSERGRCGSLEVAVADYLVADARVKVEKSKTK